MIGLTGQYAAVDEDLTGFDNLLMIGRLLEIPRKAAKRRARDLLDRFELSEAGNRSTKTYSGGMRRRLDLAASLVATPKILFLDEPTTGLDPRSRGDVWAMVRELVREGTTVLLTTQYFDEADRLANEIAVIDHGRVIARGTAAELKAKVGGQTLDVRPTDPADLDRVAGIIHTAVGTAPARRRSRFSGLDGPDGSTLGAGLSVWCRAQRLVAGSRPAAGALRPNYWPAMSFSRAVTLSRLVLPAMISFAACVIRSTFAAPAPFTQSVAPRA